MSEGCLYKIGKFDKMKRLSIRRFQMARRTEIDKLNWLIKLVLTIFLDPLVQGINRILRGRLIIGVLWIITGGVFGIGWVIDIVTVLIGKDITFLA